MKLTREKKKEKALEDLINQMFIIAGHDVTFEDIKTRQDNEPNNPGAEDFPKGS